MDFSLGDKGCELVKLEKNEIELISWILSKNSIVLSLLSSLRLLLCDNNGNDNDELKIHINFFFILAIIGTESKWTTTITGCSETN